MPDSGTKIPQNRMHLFDPVGLINDGYGERQVSNYAVQPTRENKSFDGFPQRNSNGRQRSYDSFTDADSEGLRSNDSFSVEMKRGGITTHDQSNHNNGNISGLRADPVEVRYREIPMYTAITTANRTSDHSIKEPNGSVLRFGIDIKAEDEYDVTPRLWKPRPPTSPTPMGSPLNPSSPRSAPSSPLHPSSTKRSPLNPTNSNLINSSPSSPKSIHSSPLCPTSPKYPGSPLHPNQNLHRLMSPNSRTQAIARGRKELMDMVRDLPETYYELSLKDIVERKAGMEVQKETDPPEGKKPVKEATQQEEEEEGKKSSKVKKSEKNKKKKKTARSRSVDNGKFLLKTSVFPMLLGSKKSKKSLGGSGSFKITPVPKPQAASTRSVKGPEKEWWRRKSCIASESDESNGLSSSSTSSGSSRSSSRSNSNRSNGRQSSRFLPTCCFFNGRKWNLKRIRDKE